MKPSTELYKGSFIDVPNIAKHMEIIKGKDTNDLIEQLRALTVEYTIIQFYASNNRHYCAVVFARQMNKKVKRKKIGSK